MTLLRIDSSARRNSVSRQLTQAFIETWKKENPAGQVIERDLAATPLPLITDEWALAVHSDPATLTPAQRETLSVSDALIEELLLADTIVVGAPMYNFTISAPLKAWIDQIVRVGRTVFRGPKGPEGVLKGKKVVVLTSRGGAYRPGTPTAQFAPHPRIHWIDRRYLHPRRESKARRSRRACPRRHNGASSISRRGHRSAPCCAGAPAVVAAGAATPRIN
jgi:FMN-dependent NADH-azoreductase